MSDEDKADKGRVQIAQAVKAMRSHWAEQMELIQLKADLTHARYLRLIKAGFTEAQALELCVKDISL